MSHKLQKQLKELGSKFKSLPASKDALLRLLKQAANYLSELEQSPSAFLLESLQPFFNVIAKRELLKHQDGDVKLLVATCICEITRITAPEAPYNDDVLREIFSLIVGTFRGLSDASGPSFGRRVVILDTLAKYRSCIVMLDLECYDLIKEMFSIFFSVASTELPENVQVAMETIMVVLIEESEDIHEDILLVMLSNLGRDKKDMNSAARKLAMDVIKRTAEKLEPEVKQFLISSISGLRKSTDNDLDFHEVIYGIYHCAPNILLGVISYLSVELLTDQVDVRLKALNLVRAGVEMTLIDAAAKSIDLPLWQLFGGAQNTITTDITVMIPIVSPAEAFELAAKYRKLGFETLKSKVGNNLNADIEVLKAIREVHPDCLFILDANEGFSSNETIEVLEKLYEIGVTPVLFEQPVHRDDWDGLGLVTRVAKKKFGVPVAADESCRSLSDVMRIVNGDLADVINIKLAKLGLLEALNIIKVARESGLSLMIGGMVETRLAMGFAGHLAAGLGCFKFIDLDTPLLLAKDPVLEGYEALGAVYKFTNAAGNGSFLSVEQNSQRGNIHW